MVFGLFLAARRFIMTQGLVNLLNFTGLAFVEKIRWPVFTMRKSGKNTKKDTKKKRKRPNHQTGVATAASGPGLRGPRVKDELHGVLEMRNQIRRRVLLESEMRNRMSLGDRSEILPWKNKKMGTTLFFCRIGTLNIKIETNFYSNLMLVRPILRCLSPFWTLPASAETSKQPDRFNHTNGRTSPNGPQVRSRVLNHLTSPKW